MENNKQTNNVINLKTIIAIIIIGFFVFGSITAFFSSDKEAKRVAEAKMNQLVYIELGVVPQNFNSNVIYKDGKKKIVVVKYGLTNKDWDGSACFYINDKYIINYSNIMGADYDYQGNIENIKAMFGI